MSVTRYVRRTFTFDWDGTTYGMRLPNTDEMIAITEARDKFVSTINDEHPGGSQPELTRFQFLLGSTLACDPENAGNPWFAADTSAQAELKKQGIDKDLAIDMPSSFFVAAAEFFNLVIVRENLSDEDRKKYDENLAKVKEQLEQSAKDGDKQPGEVQPSEASTETGTPTTPTQQNSEDSVSESLSSSSATSIPSTSGDTTAS